MITFPGIVLCDKHQEKVKNNLEREDFLFNINLRLWSDT